MKVVSNFRLANYRGSHDIAVHDDIAYVCNYWKSTLIAIDLKDLQNLSLISLLKEESTRGIHDIAIIDNMAYTTNCLDNSIAAIDISDPYNMKVISSLKNDKVLNLVHALCVTKDYIYAGSHKGFHIGHYFSIIDRTKMSIISSISTKLRIRGVCFNEGYCFASSPDGFLIVIDVSDPTNIQICSILDICGYNTSKRNLTSNIRYVNGIVYITFGKCQALIAVDVSSVNNPVILSGLEVSRPNYLEVHNNHIYVSSCKEFKKITVVDISEPNSIEEVDSITHNDLEFSCGLQYYKGHLLCCSRDSKNILTVIKV